MTTDRDEPESGPADDADWPALDPGPPPAPRHSTRRPVAVAVAAALLALDGISGIVTGVLSPMLPEALANVAPILTGIMGLAGLVAAVGAWRLAEWGRVLGLGVALGWLIQDGLLAQTAAALGIDPLLGRAPNPLFDWVVPLAADVLILASLALRWPRPAASTDED